MRFLTRYASDIKAAKAALFSFEISESRLRGCAHLFIAVVRETFECSDRRGCRGKTQCLNRGRPQPSRPSSEQSAARLRELDERLNGGGAPDATEREDELPFHAFVLFLFHRDHERHRERAGLAAADAEGRLHPDLR